MSVQVFVGTTSLFAGEKVLSLGQISETDRYDGVGEDSRVGRCEVETSTPRHHHRCRCSRVPRPPISSGIRGSAFPSVHEKPLNLAWALLNRRPEVTAIIRTGI